MNTTQEELQVAMVEDLPRSFIYNFNNQSYYSGPYAEIIYNFASYHNLKLVLTILEEIVSSKEIHRHLIREKYNITTFSSTYEMKKDGIQYSYPVEWMRKCVMVQLDEEISKFLYILWPYGRYIWTVILLGSIYIGILMRFIDTRPGYIPTRSIIRNIPHALNITLYTMNMQINIQNPSIRIFYFYTLLYLYGFILSAYYQPYLTAYNMKPIFVRPITTDQDILDAKLKILITNSDFDDIVELKMHDFSNIANIFQNVTNQQYENLLITYNRSFAYVISEDEWQFIKRQQAYLKKPFFHLTPLCFNAAFRSFPLIANWKYSSSLDLFLLRIQQSGLWQQWADQAFARAVASGYAQILLDTYPVEALNLEYFTVAWSVLTIGFIFSLIVHFIEHSIWRYRARKIIVE